MKARISNFNEYDDNGQLAVLEAFPFAFNRQQEKVNRGNDKSFERRLKVLIGEI